MLIRSFGVDAGVDTRFGFFGSPACSGKLSRFVGDVYVAGVDAAAGGAVFAVSIAAVGFSVLNAFYMQVARICLYAFADKLRTLEGGIPAASDGGFAGRTADMGVAMGCFCLIAVMACWKKGRLKRICCFRRPLGSNLENRIRAFRTSYVLSLGLI